MVQLTRNFSSSEFQCPCCGAGGALTITSGYRCASHNEEVGGVPGSAHTTGQAVDIACSNSSDRYRLMRILTKYFGRVGIASSFIHVDVDITKPQDVLWTY